MIVTCMVVLMISGVSTPTKLTGETIRSSKIVCNYFGKRCYELEGVDFTKDLTKKGLFGKVTGVQYVSLNNCVIRIGYKE